MKRIHKIGDKYNYIEIIGLLGRIKNKTYVKIKCDCGNYKVIQSCNVKNTKSCGCKTFHGLRSHPLYCVWDNIKGRCYRKSNPKYNIYGGRGITLYDEWKNDFKIFYDYCMSNGWEEGLRIDRINPDKGYYPNNIRFVTIQQNNFNLRKRKNCTSKYKGVSFYKNKNKWRCRIFKGGKNYYLGLFDSEEEAALVYNNKAIELFGEYAHLNNVESNFNNLQKLKT